MEPKPSHLPCNGDKNDDILSNNICSSNALNCKENDYLKNGDQVMSPNEDLPMVRSSLDEMNDGDNETETEENLMSDVCTNEGQGLATQKSQGDEDDGHCKKPDDVEDSDVNERNEDFGGIPVDRGWAWMVVVGCFGMHVVVMGGCKSFGVLYVEFQDKYQASAGALTAVISLPMALMFGLGIFGNTLAAQFSSRSVVFIGSIISCLGFFLTAIMPEFIGIVFTFGILTGIGFCLCYGPGVIMVAHHFKKYRSLANGISIAGSGVGSFAIPNLMRYLLREYGLPGCLYIFSGIILNVAVFAMFFRPFSSYQKKRTRQDAGNCDKVNQTGNNFYSNNEKDTEYVSLMQKEKVTSDSGDKQIVFEYRENGMSDSTHHVIDEQMCSVKNDGKNHLLQRILSQSALTPAHSFGDIHSLSMQALNDLEQSEFRGKGGEHRDGDSVTGGEKEQKKSWLLELKSRFDFSLLVNPVFLLCAVPCFLATPGYTNVFMILPDHAESNGQDRDSSALITSIIGISDLVGRLFFGWFSDLNLIPKRWGFMGCMAMTGILNLVLPSLKTFSGLVLFAVAFGTFGGSYITLIAVLLAEDLGLERMGSSFGLNALFIALAVFAGPPICGSLKDMTGSWDAAFYFIGTLTLTGAFLPIFHPYATRWVNARK